MENRITQGVTFLAGILAGVFLYRTGFNRGRVFQSVISRQSLIAERRRQAFEGAAREALAGSAR